MNSTYTLNVVHCDTKDEGKNDAFDVAAAITTDSFATHPSGKWGINHRTNLYLPAYPSECGTGDVASNFRFKHDKDTNNNVCKNWISLLETYKKESTYPVVVTAINRNSRSLSIRMNEGGSVTVINKLTKEELEDETSLFSQFLTSNNITPDIMMKMRESSKGARYYTYLSDVLSFLNIINSKFNPEMFIQKTLQVNSVNTGDLDSEGNHIIKPFIQENGEEWKPKEGYDYLYFKESCTMDNSNTNNYLLLKDDFIPMMYHQFLQLISNEENDTKQKVRTFFSSINTFLRWSDYWINDIDDALTILAIIHCYRFTDTLTKEEEHIKNNFSEIAKQVFS
tara:strand:+ start:779 stop:1792 length:1014 start_codon:yes stop_codon:yes gene_type:complete